MDLSNVPEHTKAGLIAMNAGKILASRGEPAKIASDIIQHYLDGNSVESIAREFGTSSERLYQILVSHAEEPWKNAQAAKALRKLEEAEIALEQAQDGISIGRARENARLQCWRLERVLRRIYGQDAPSINIQVNLGDIGQRIQDLERELLPTQE